MTGNIARTATNIRAGARTPVSGILHAVICNQPKVNYVAVGIAMMIFGAGFASFLGKPLRMLAPDLDGSERLVLVVLALWLIVLGFVPSVLVDPATELLK